MSSEINSSSNSESGDPFGLLGIKPGASFDEIQKARNRKLEEVGDNQIEKAKIEASYDALLMSSLKERQLGNKVSSEAINASKKEERNVFSDTAKSLGSSFLNQLKTSNSKDLTSSNNLTLSLPSGQDLAIRISLGLLALVLLLVSPSESVQLILSISTLGLCYSQVRRGGKFFKSLLTSFSLLFLGLIIGQLIFTQVTSFNGINETLSLEQLEALPAMILIWLGVIFLD